MFTSNVLLAGIFDKLLEVLVPLAFFIFWLISSIAGARQKAKQGRQPPRPVDDLPGQDELESEISKFLKQAKNKRSGGDIEVFDPVAEPIKQPLMAEPPDAELVHSLPRSELADRHAVSAQVAADLDTSRTKERIERMGDNVEIADDVMAAHVQEVFDHSIGTLTDTSDRGYGQDHTDDDSELGEITRTPTAAVDFAALLASSDNLRQAIVMNEILQRPTDRW